MKSVPLSALTSYSLFLQASTNTLKAITTEENSPPAWHEHASPEVRRKYLGEMKAQVSSALRKANSFKQNIPASDGLQPRDGLHPSSDALCY